MAKLSLVSFYTCPYVQRAAIVLAEKGQEAERVYIDLANKPDWFKAISPLGKVPVLRVDDAVVFESAVILEYLEDVFGPKLHPSDALRRADHRAWMEFGSTIQGELWGFYTAADEQTFDAKRKALAERFAWVEKRLKAEPWFDGSEFSLVDAVYAPIFRYFTVFDEIGDFGILSGKPKIARWRQSLAARPSVRNAVVADYYDRLRKFIASRDSHMSRLMAKDAEAA